MSATAHEEAVRRLRWRCRRGMKELDLLLERYLEQRYPAATAMAQRAFAELLELPDPVVHAYVVGRIRPPGEAMRDVIGAISGPEA